MASKFNIGDRVRVTDDALVMPGEYGTVVLYEGSMCDTAVLIDGDYGSGTAMYDHELELVEQGVAPDKKLSAPKSVVITTEDAQVEVSLVDGRLIVNVTGQATIDWSE